LSEEELLHYFTMICLAIEQTHYQGLCHGNFSSSHIYLSQDKKVAKLASFANPTHKTHQQKRYHKPFIGELFYASPEVRHGAACSKEGDMWALGAFLLELVVLEKP
jgi:serine/threonine protein kinase